MAWQSFEDQEANKFAFAEATKIASLSGSNLTYEQYFALAKLISDFIKTGENPYSKKENKDGE